MWWAAVLALLAGLLTAAVMLRAAYRVFWGERPGEAAPAAGPEVREVPASLWVPMAVLAAACLALGVFPQAAYPLLDRAATALATLGR
jgi:formate hydrogenlyase subunit 3/multisubunit Na+/H+ antiporter MnhD subunit